MENNNSEKFYLGISLGFNSSACVMSNKRGLIAAVSQERLCGIKNTKEFPVDAIIECIKLAKAPFSYKFDVGISHYQHITAENIYKYLPEKYKDYMGTFHNVCLFGLDYVEDCLKALACVLVNSIVRVEHHTAHAYAALVMHGKDANMSDDRNIFVTCDGFGDGTSGRIVLGSGEVLASLRLVDSVGLFYQFVTGALGYKEHQHEGKITGLAAFGKPIYVEKLVEVYSQMLSVDLSKEQSSEVKASNIENFNLFLRLKDSTYKLVNCLLGSGALPEDIAASVQFFTEMVIINWLNSTIEKYTKKTINFPLFNVYFSGGLFANVKLNQKIHALPWVENIYVCPAMGDEGTCIGAAFHAMKEKIGMEVIEANSFLKHQVSPYLGTKHEYSAEQVILELANLRASESVCVHELEDAQLINCIAKHLTNKKIVCLFRGRMEFGPRALGNRSILYHCTDRTVNMWLNEQLGRTEFMPFAPICKMENAGALFDKIGAEQTAEYMTITFNCSDEFKNNYPAACHIDGTARPQLVTKEANRFMWNLLDKYESISCQKVLINTSFNLHNFPIIESPEDAIQSWFDSNTDVLVINNVVIERMVK